METKFFIRISASEKEAYKQRAKKIGLSLSAWVRMVLLAESKKEDGK